MALLAVLGAIVYAGGQRHHDVTLSAQAITDSSTTTTTLPRPPKTWGAYRPFTATVSGANGRTRIEQSLNCNAGGDGSYWHFQSEAALPAGIITGPQSTLPGDLRVFAAVNSPYHGVRSTPEPVPGPTQNDAFLLPDGSHAALTNQRGSVKLGLSSGSCPARDQSGAGFTLDFDGTTAATNEQPGSWSILDAAGSYRQAKSPGDGRFDLTADVSPGADDPWSMTLRGSIAVLQPALDVRVVNTYWGRDGVDYAARQVAVTYQVTNVGYGDAFDVRLTNATSPTPGASLIAVIVNGDNLLIDGNTPVGAPQRSLGDLSELETTTVTLKWQLPLPAGNPPCGLVILSCQFDTTLTFSVPDAMDVPLTPAPVVTLHAKAPDLPPPA